MLERAKPDLIQQPSSWLLHNIAVQSCYFIIPWQSCIKLLIYQDGSNNVVQVCSFIKPWTVWTSLSTTLFKLSMFKLASSTMLKPVNRQKQAVRFYVCRLNIPNFLISKVFQNTGVLVWNLHQSTSHLSKSKKLLWPRLITWTKSYQNLLLLKRHVIRSHWTVFKTLLPFRLTHKSRKVPEILRDIRLSSSLNQTMGNTKRQFLFQPVIAL